MVTIKEEEKKKKLAPGLIETEEGTQVIGGIETTAPVEEPIETIPEPVPEPEVIDDIPTPPKPTTATATTPIITGGEGAEDIAAPTPTSKVLDEEAFEDLKARQQAGQVLSEAEKINIARTIGAIQKGGLDEGAFFTQRRRITELQEQQSKGALSSTAQTELNRLLGVAAPERTRERLDRPLATTNVDVAIGELVGRGFDAPLLISPEIPGISSRVVQSGEERLLDELTARGFSEGEAKEAIKRSLATKREEEIRVKGEESLAREKEIQEARTFEVTTRLQKAGEARIKSIKDSIAFAGGGRGSFAINKIAEVEAEVGRMIELEQKIKDNRLELARKQQEGADTSELSRITKDINQAVNDLRSAENRNTIAIAELNAKTKIKGAEALENLLAGLSEESKTSLNSAGFNKDLSAKVGKAVDRNGKVILVDGKEVIISGSKEDSLTIDNFAEELLQGGKTSVTIPSELRTRVSNRLAILRKAKEDSGDIVKLNPLQTLQSDNLAVKIFGKRAGAKQENKDLVRTLFGQGMSVDDIEDSLRKSGFGVEFTGTIKNVFNQLTIKGFTKDNKVDLREQLEDLVAESGKESQEVKEFILGIANAGAGAVEQQQQNGRIQLIDSVARIKTDLDEYIKKGGNTNLLSGTVENLTNKVLGATGDPELAEIAGKISIALINYRKAISGAAFTEAEGEEYRRVLPSIGVTPELNQARVNSLLDVSSNFVNQFYRGRLGLSSFSKLFPDGTLNTLVPEFELDEGIGGIGRGLEKSITNEIFGEDKGTVIDKTTGQNTFKTNSGIEFNLDEFDFNKAEETAITNTINGRAVAITSGTSTNRPDRNNNPGNVKSSPVNRELSTKTDNQGHLIFDNPQDGLEALKNDLFSKLEGRTQVTALRIKVNDGTATLNDLGKAFAEDINWAKGVGSILGINPTTKLTDIDKFDLLKAIPKQEGFTGSINF